MRSGQPLTREDELRPVNSLPVLIQNGCRKFKAVVLHFRMATDLRENLSGASVSPQWKGRQPSELASTIPKLISTLLKVQ